MISSANAPDPEQTNTTRDLFISFNTSDRAAVLKVRENLQLRSITTFYDGADLTPGEPWFDELEAALRRVRAVAVFIGKDGLGTVQKREMQFALAWQGNEEKARRRFPVIPVLLEGAEPESISGFLALNTWVDLRRGLDDPAGLDAFSRALRQEVPSLRPETAAPTCPYRSLQVFREADAGLFFGRDVFSRKLLDQVLDHNPVTVIGASGSGKSSIVQAGLLPLLRRQRPPEATWESIVFTPGSKPFQRLAAPLVRLWSKPGRDLTDIATESEKLAARLADGEVTLANFIDLALQQLPDTGRLIAVVDQFEELFTQTIEKEQRTRFVNQLLTAARESKLTVVLTLRADFYAHAIGLPELSDCLGSGIVNVREMARAELEAAIQGPAARTGLEFETGLVDRILDQVEGQPGSLPLLEYALTELWRQRIGGRLTHAGYDAIGGVEGAISKRAEALFDKLAPVQKEMALPAISRLVRVSAAGEEGTDTRQIVPVNEFSAETQTVLNMFAAPESRLLVMSRDEAENQETVTVAHEALIRGWERLKKWIDRDREFLLWRQQLQMFLRKWKALIQDKQSGLLAGIYLAEAARWLRERGKDLNTEEIQYIRLSERPAERRRHWKQLAVWAALVSAVTAGFVLWWTRRDEYQIQQVLSTASTLMRQADETDAGDWLAALVYSGRAKEAIREAESMVDAGQRTKSLCDLTTDLQRIGHTAESVEAAAKALADLQHVDPLSKPFVAEPVANALALAGSPQEVRALAEGIENEPARLRTFRSMARALAKNGNSNAAADLVRNSEEPTALLGVSRGLAEAGKTDEALAIAQRVKQPDLKAYAIAQISTALAHVGKLEGARSSAEDVLKTAERVKDEPRLSYSLSWAALAMAKAGRIPDALAITQRITEPASHDQALIFIAETLASSGKVEEALAAAQLAKTPSGRSLAFGNIIEALISAAMGTRAAEVSLNLKRTGDTATGVFNNEIGLAAIVTGTATQQPREALAIALRIEDPTARAAALVDVAEALLHAGDREAARKTALQALPGLRGEPGLRYQVDYLAREMIVFGELQLRSEMEEAAFEAIKAADRQAGEGSETQAFSDIAAAYAKLHLYRKARLIVNRGVTSSERLSGETAILREYTISTHPETANLFETPAEYAPIW